MKTMILDKAFNAGSRPALFIPAPSVRHAGKTTYLTTFNALADSPAPKAIGKVEDMAMFSKSLGLAPDAGKAELWIKDTGTGFYIPPQYAQFEETARKMIAHYYRLHGDDGPVALAIHQAVINPNASNPRPYLQAHKDINLNRIRDEGQAPNVYSMIVSDSLGTGFSGYKLTPEDIEKLQSSENPNQALEDILNKPGVSYRSDAPPGTITAFPAISDHALANPAVPTFRTVFLMSFFPAGEKLGVEMINNPWLSAAISDRDAKPSANLQSPDYKAGRHL